MAITKKSMVGKTPSKKQITKAPVKVSKSAPSSKLHTAMGTHSGL